MAICLRLIKDYLNKFTKKKPSKKKASNCSGVTKKELSKN